MILSIYRLPASFFQLACAIALCTIMSSSSSSNSGSGIISVNAAVTIDPSFISDQLTDLRHLRRRGNRLHKKRSNRDELNFMDQSESDNLMDQSESDNEFASINSPQDGCKSDSDCPDGSWCFWGSCHDLSKVSGGRIKG